MDDAATIWDLIDRANTAWLSGRPRDTAELFDPAVRLVAPGLTAVVDGRDAVVQTYVDAAAAMTTDRFEVTDRSLHVDDDVAVATYVFDITYRVDGQEHHERGQEVLVLRGDDGGRDRWRVVWRTQVPLPPNA